MSANWALQVAVKSLLAADATLRNDIGTNPVRLYQDPPAGTTFPGSYVVFGDTTDVPSLAECVDGWEIFLTFNIYTREQGFQTVKRIGARIDTLLHNANLTLATGFRCVLIERADPTRYVKAPDNMTAHGVVTFRAEVEPT